MKRNLAFRRMAVLAAAVVLTVMTQSAYGFSINRSWHELKVWFMSGGNTMWFILACSVITVAFSLERAIRLRRDKVVPQFLLSRARTLWTTGDYEDLIAICQQTDVPLAHAIQLMVENRHVPVEDIRPIVADAMSTEMQMNYRRIRPLHLSAMIAPLLGLFGTVSGMIGAFRSFRQLGETGDPTVFAGDISVALVTTQAGLLVALATMPLAWFFTDRTNRLADELDMAAQQLLIEWFVTPDNRPIPAGRGAVTAG